MSIVKGNGKVDGNALVDDLLDALGLTAHRVTWMSVEPTQVTVEYLLVDEDGKFCLTADGGIAKSVVVLPMEWSKK